MAPKLPPFPQSMRLARPGDIDRLAVIAFAGGLRTDEFKYERPYAHQYPEDTLNAWRHYLAASLRSQYDTIVVIEDTANLDEDELTPPTVPLRYSLLGAGRCVVGFARLKLRPSYPNERVFEHFHIRDWTSVGRKRDQNFDNTLEYGLGVALECKRLIDTKLSLETLTVHPAYHRRGHGKSLVSWIKNLAKFDNVAIGVVATRLGIPLYRSLNFERVHSFEVVAGIPVQLMRYDPASKILEKSKDKMAVGVGESDESLREICDGLCSLAL